MSLASLPISPRDFVDLIAKPALKMLPDNMTSDKALVLLCAIAQQESGLRTRWQIIDLKRPNVMGPARGLLQFEKGGGVKGVLTHPSTKAIAADFCKARGVAATTDAVFDRLSSDDILAAGFGRLLLWSDAAALPALGAVSDGWACYIRNWRPGRPHPDQWSGNYSRALAAVNG